jgi:hypothetical protein
MSVVLGTSGIYVDSLRTVVHKVDGDRRIINDGTPFRCIDVETGELVEMYLADHYIALSYV